MKRIVVIAVVVALGGISVSVASGAVHAWSASKSERMLVNRGAVQLPASERAALDEELRYAVLQYSALSYAAAELGDSQASLTYHRVAGEYRRALAAVVGGIDIADAACSGSGRAHGDSPGAHPDPWKRTTPVAVPAAAQRFQRFECLVVSDVLSIPTTELGTVAEGDLPPVIQRDPRHVGPLVTWVHIRVTGPSSFGYE